MMFQRRSVRMGTVSHKNNADSTWIESERDFIMASHFSRRRIASMIKLLMSFRLTSTFAPRRGKGKNSKIHLQLLRLTD